MDIELLKKFIAAKSPTGREDEVIRLVADTTKAADAHLFDIYGSIITVYNQDADFKVGLMAHADEISLVVNGYNKDGTLTVASNGGIRERLYVGCKINIMTPKGVVKGAMGLNSSLLKKEKVTVKDLFVEIGCATAEEAKALVPIGSPILIDAFFDALAHNYVCARAFDDRLGVFITQEAAKQAFKNGAQCGIYCVASVGEENTGRGAYASASLIKPDCMIVVDVTYATDYHGCDLPGDIKLGKGGVITVGSTINRKLVALVEEVAREHQLPLQYEVSTGSTYTDGDSVLKTNTGMPFIVLSIPLRYMHSSVEVAKIEDIATIIDLLAFLLVKLNKGIDFHPYSF